MNILQAHYAQHRQHQDADACAKIAAIHSHQKLIKASADQPATGHLVMRQFAGFEPALYWLLHHKQERGEQDKKRH